MNIESKTVNSSTSVKNMASKSASNSVSQSTDSKSFKGELESIKATEQTQAQETKDADLKATQQSEKDASLKAEDAAKNEKAEKIQKAEKVDAANKKNDLNVSNTEESGLLSPLKELNQKLAMISEIKKSSLKSQDIEKDHLEATLDYNVVKMDKNDALFFANLVNGENLKLQPGAGGSDFAEIKTESLSAASQVSKTLMDSLSDAMKTGKPFRIDFDKDVAVIMRVDKEGKLSAEFIPGDKAVEQYLKNNIPLLKESFDRQNLSYNELSYQKHKQQQQENNNNRKEYKENDDE